MKPVNDTHTSYFFEEKYLSANLVDCLINTFNTEGINYCHWKSNIDLAQATSGEMDLDFLIDRESFRTAISILSRLGFKAAGVRWGVNSPGISHYYGYDPVTERFVHVHLFSRVLTGESFSKSHLLPFESMLLENTYFDGQMRVTSKSAELVLFTIRTYIKYGSLLDIVFLRKKTEKIKTELRWLKDGGDMATSVYLLNKYCPVIDEKLFVECLNMLERNSSLFQRIRLAQKVRRGIRSYAKFTYLERISSYLQLGFTQIQRRLSSSKKNKVLQTGGAVIAIVGADATGKSTLVSETSRWLGENFIVRKMHAGKPPTTWATAPVNLVLNLFRRFKPKLGQTNQEHHHSSSGKGEVSPSGGSLASLLVAIRAVTLAWDRRNLLLKGWRAAARGEIVVFDRYPSNNIGAMDSPRLKENTGGESTLYNLAARLEQYLYAQIPPPDLVIRLQVSVETAIARNRLRDKTGEETDEYIESRHRHIQIWHRPDTGRIFDVDTEQSLAETKHEIKEIIWNAL
jgi:thymidylate kinase